MALLPDDKKQQPMAQGAGAFDYSGALASMGGPTQETQAKGRSQANPFGGATSPATPPPQSQAAANVDTSAQTDWAHQNGDGYSQTGYLNFDRFADANSGVARKRALDVNKDVANRQGRAHGATDALANTYSQALSGYGTAADSNYDEAGNWLGGAAGPQPMAATEPTATPQPAAHTLTPEEKAAAEARARAGARTNPAGVGDGPQLPQTTPTTTPEAPRTAPLGDTAPGETPEEAARRATLNQGIADALKSMQDIGSFEGAAGYGDAQHLAADADAARDATRSNADLQALTGDSAADAALYGAYGRPQFAATQGQYGGVGGGYGYLNEITQQRNEAGQAARDKFAQRGDDYASQLAQLDATQQKRVDDWNAAKKKAAEDAAKAQEDAARRAEYNKMRDDANGAFNWVKTAAETTDPISWLWGAASNGEQNPATMAVNNAIGNRVFTGWQDTDVDFNIWNSMTDSDRYKFEHMNPQEQEAWLEEQRKKYGG